MKNLIMIILATLAFLGLISQGTSEVEVMRMETNQHCEMVDLWKSTDGDLGWPDYNKSYEESCK